MKVKKPNISISNVLAALCAYISLLLFMVLLHIFSIATTGGTQEVVTIVFIWYLWVYLFLCALGIIGGMAQIMMYAIWILSTPKWVRKQR